MGFLFRIPFAAIRKVDSDLWWCSRVSACCSVTTYLDRRTLARTSRLALMMKQGTTALVPLYFCDSRDHAQHSAVRAYTLIAIDDRGRGSVASDGEIVGDSEFIHKSQEVCVWRQHDRVVPARAPASSIAARSVQTPFPGAVSRTPSPGLESDASTGLVIVKTAASAEAKRKTARRIIPMTMPQRLKFSRCSKRVPSSSLH